MLSSKIPFKYIQIRQKWQSQKIEPVRKGLCESESNSNYGSIVIIDNLNYEMTKPSEDEL